MTHSYLEYTKYIYFYTVYSLVCNSQCFIGEAVQDTALHEDFVNTQYDWFYDDDLIGHGILPNHTNF